MLIGGRENPYAPGAGETPPELAGRREALVRFETELQQLKARVPGGRMIFLTGPPGGGKTALLRWLQRRAAAQRLKAAWLIPDGRRSEAGLVLGLEPEGRPGGAIRERRDGPLVLILDDAQELDLALARSLFSSCRSPGMNEPVLLAVAGGADLSMHLRGARIGFIDFAKWIRIGGLDDEAAFRALAAPLEARGIGFDEEALRRASASAANHPHFLQCWGRALWDAEAASLAALPDRRPHVGPAAFEAARGAAEAAVEKICASKLEEIEAFGLLAAAAELALEAEAGMHLRVAVEMQALALAARWEMNGKLPRFLRTDTHNPEWSAEQLLLHTGFVWKPGLCKPEFGIPLLADRAVRTAARRLAGMIADCGLAPIVRALLDFDESANSAGSREEIAGSLLRSGAAIDARQAGDALAALERFGIVGPDGLKASDGTPGLCLQAPRLLRRALEQAETLEWGARMPGAWR